MKIKSILYLAVLLVLGVSVGHATTWFVNQNGDTRFSSNVSTGHCNGKNAQSYAAAGGTGSQTNLDCAFNDIRLLWTDGTFTNTPTGSFPAWGWIGAGGDTYLIDCTGTAKCRIGQNGPNSGDWFGLAGDPYNAGAPTPPAGTSGAHTRILGANFATCTMANETKIQGGFGVSAFIFLGGASWTDISCFDVTQHENCTVGVGGPPVDPCSTGFPLSDYMKNCFTIENNTTNVHLDFINCHGAANRGIIGPPGDGFTLSNSQLTGNPASGFDMDDGFSSTTGQGTTQLLKVIVYGNGCKEQYPLVTVPAPWGPLGMMANCLSASNGGYGDGVGTRTTPSTSAWHIIVDQSTFACNTQDGLDMLHATGVGNTKLVTRSRFYCNMGQQLKAGDPQATVQNNIFNGNCFAMSQTSPAPLGFLPGYGVGLSGGDFCRAGSSTIAITPSDAAITIIQNNTVNAGTYIAWEIAPPIPPDDCTTLCKIIFQNNVAVLFATSVGSPPGNSKNTNQIFFDPCQFGVCIPDSLFANTGSINSFNSTLNGSSPCPYVALSETNALCSDPGLVDETFHQVDYGNVAPASMSSAVVGAGIFLSGVPLDFNGTVRPNPPSMGALEFAGGVPTVATPTPAPPTGSYSSTQSITLTTITAGAIICYTIGTSPPNPTASIGGTCDVGSTTYSGPITVSVTTTIKAIGTLSGDTNSGVGTYAYTITPPPSTITIKATGVGKATGKGKG